MNNKFLGLILGLTVGAIGTTQSNVRAATFTGTITPSYACEPGVHTCSGSGTADFSFGQAVPGSFSSEIVFTGATYNSIPPTGNFSVGTLSITNGTVYQSTFPATIDGNNATIYMDLIVQDAEGTKQGNYLIAYNGTTNLNPVLNSSENADYVYFPYNPEFGAFYILEGDTLNNALGSISILASDPPGVLTLQGFDPKSGAGKGYFAALPTGTIDPTSGLYTPTSAPEPFTIVGSLIGGTAALRMRKKLKDSAKLA